MPKSNSQVQRDVQALVQNYHDYVKAQAAGDDAQAKKLIEQAAAIGDKDPDAFLQFIMQGEPADA